MRHRSERVAVLSFSTFFDVADWFKTKQCLERQRGSSCNCTSRYRTDWNPCNFAQKRIDNAMARAMGEGLPNDLTIDDLISHANRRRCDQSKAGKACSHKGCDDSERCSTFLYTERDRLAAAS